MDGRDIRTIRQQLGLTQREFAENLGVGRRTVIRWESNLTTPDSEVQEKLSHLVEKVTGDTPKNVTGECDILNEKVTGDTPKSDTSTQNVTGKPEKVTGKSDTPTPKVTGKGDDVTGKCDRVKVTTQTYLETMYSEAKGFISLCTLTQQSDSNQKPSLQVKGFYDISQIPDLLTEVDRLNGQCHIYTGIHPLKAKPEKGRGKEKDILGIALVAADVDAKDFIDDADEREKANEEKGFYQWTDELLSECKGKALAHIHEVCAKVEILPTAIIDSGHGFYPIFKFDNFIEFSSDQHREELKQLNKTFHEAFAADSTFDFARILRVPDTRNIKPGYPTDCKIIEFHPGRCYTIDDLKQFESLITEPEQIKSKPKTEVVSSLDDQILIEKAMNAQNGAKFTALWNSDSSGYKSQSEADLALCCEFAFWTGGDRDRIDRLFRQSGLYREKWEREDYRERTIDAALEKTTTFYDPNWNGDKSDTVETPDNQIPDEELDTKQEYNDILNTIETKLENTDDLSSIEQSERIQETLREVAQLNRTDQARYLKLIAEKFNVTQKALKDDMKLMSAGDFVEPKGRGFGNIHELNGYNVEGEREIGYLKVEFPLQYMISTFIIEPKSKLWIDGFEAINATFISEHETIEDVVIERKNWNTPERFLDIIPSSKMSFTGDRKDIQNIMLIVSSYDVPTQVATKQTGWHQDKIWVGSNLNLDTDGIIEPAKVFYYPVGGHNTIDDIVSYNECNDTTFSELQAQSKKLLKLNEDDVIIPVIGWFHGAFAKRCWLDHPNIRHFPHLNVAGSRGSGKSTLIEIFWRVFGWTGDALINCSMSRFALLRTFASTNSYPIVLDEFKPANMPDDRVANIREFMRHSYGGAIDQRGRPDQSIVEYHLTAPICLVGEMPYYPLEAAAIERVIPIHTNFNAINPDTEQGKQRTELCWQLQQIDWTGYLSRYIRYLTTIDLDTQIEYAREDTARYLGDRDVPHRIWDNIAAVVFGLRQYENFNSVMIDDAKIASAVKTIITHLCGEAGNRGKLAFELALEQMAVMAELGRLKEKIHYLINDSEQICLRLSACLSEFRRFARETNWTGEVLDDNAYRRQIAEIKEEGRLIAETSHLVRGWSGNANNRARSVIIQKSEDIDLEGFYLKSQYEET